MQPIKLAITGAAGRIGQRLIALAKADPAWQLVGTMERPDHPAQGRDAGEVAGIGPIGVPITFDLRPKPKVLIDFSTPASTRHWLKTCRDRDIAMVIGTTGLNEKDHATIDQAAMQIPILQAPNMSLGVNLLLKLVADGRFRLFRRAGRAAGVRPRRHQCHGALRAAQWLPRHPAAIHWRMC
jgi:4-hydroxy-tetrahydrodipicolinate reductase